MKRYFRTVFICFLLTACVPGASQHAKFYNLKTETNTVISNSYRNSIAVQRIQMPKFMDRPQIISHQKGKAEIAISEYNRWVEPLSVLYTRTLAENISTMLPNAPIKMSGSDDSFNRVISINIVKMDSSWNDKATLKAWYTVRNGKREILVSKKFSDSIPMGHSYENLVKVHSQLLANLSKAIADTLVNNE